VKGFDLASYGLGFFTPLILLYLLSLVFAKSFKNEKPFREK